MENQYFDRKEELIKVSRDYQETLNEDLNVMTDVAFDWGTKLLSIGGGVLVSYIIFKRFFNGSKKDSGKQKGRKYSNSNIKYIFLKSLSDKAAIILLELLREYLVKRIGKISDNEEKENL